MLDQAVHPPITPAGRTPALKKQVLRRSSMTGEELRERIDGLSLFPRQPSGELGVHNATKAGNLLGVGRTTLLGYLRGAFPVPARVAQQVECLSILRSILKSRKVSVEDLRRIEAVFETRYYEEHGDER